MRYLLDSVILIDHFNGIAAATEYLAETRGEAAVSVITRAEVLAGFGATDVGLAAALLDRFPTLPVERQVADLAARLRHDLRWKMPDALQAALARHHGLHLVTRNTRRNTRDFPPDRYPFVVVPYVF